MKLITSFLFLMMVCSVVRGQFMLGKGLDDILDKYQNDRNFRLSVLRIPKGTAIRKLKIGSVVDTRDTGDSENSIVSYTDLKTDDLYTFYLVNDRCINFQHTYNIKDLLKIKTMFDKEYNRVEAGGIANDEWVSSDGVYKIVIIPYESLHIFDVQYSLN